MPLTGVSLAFAAMQGTLLFLTFFFQIVRGWSPLQAGLLVLPFAAGQLLGAPRSAKMVQRFGARTVITGGLLFALAGMIGFALITPATPVWVLVLIGLVFGFGLGNTIAPSTTRMTLATPPERSGARIRGAEHRPPGRRRLRGRHPVLGGRHCLQQQHVPAARGQAAPPGGTAGCHRLDRRHQ